jgi:hypothetical protein
LKDLQVFTIIRVIFQLADEIPCISAVVVALLAEVTIHGGGVYSFICACPFVGSRNQFKISGQTPLTS